MGQQQKIDNGNFMGKSGTYGGVKAKVTTGPKASFKSGSILKGLPGNNDNFPKGGKMESGKFQDMRHQDIRRGKI